MNDLDILTISVHCYPVFGNFLWKRLQAFKDIKRGEGGGGGGFCKFGLGYSYLIWKTLSFQTSKGQGIGVLTELVEELYKIGFISEYS